MPTAKHVRFLEGNKGRIFRVGEKLPENTYDIPEGKIAALINEFIPVSCFILIRNHEIIDILDCRDGAQHVKIDTKALNLDAIGLNEHDFDTNDPYLSGTATKH